MADKGNLASFTFDSVTYTTADCIQGWNLNDAVNDIVYQCAGYDRHLVGTRNANFSMSMGLNATDTSIIGAFNPGEVTTDFAAYPGGKTTNYIAVLCTDAFVVSRNVSAPMNAIITMDVVIALNNVNTTDA